MDVQPGLGRRGEKAAYGADAEEIERPRDGPPEEVALAELRVEKAAEQRDAERDDRLQDGGVELGERCGKHSKELAAISYQLSAKRNPQDASLRGEASRGRCLADSC